VDKGDVRVRSAEPGRPSVSVPARERVARVNEQISTLESLPRADKLRNRDIIERAYARKEALEAELAPIDEVLNQFICFEVPGRGTVTFRPKSYWDAAPFLVEGGAVLGYLSLPGTTFRVLFSLTRRLEAPGSGGR
jgi:hypothetical protein